MSIFLYKFTELFISRLSLKSYDHSTRSLKLPLPWRNNNGQSWCWNSPSRSIECCLFRYNLSHLPWWTRKRKRGENYRFVQTLLGSVTELRRFHSTFSNICIVARYRLVSVYADLLTTLIRWGLFFKITNNARLMI